MDCCELYGSELSLLDRMESGCIYSDSMNRVASLKKRINVVEGKNGYGKTSLIAMLSKRLRNENCICIPLMLKNSFCDLSVDDILRRLIYRISLKDVDKVEKLRPWELKGYLSNLVKQAIKTSQIIIFIDDLDALPEGNIKKLLFSIPQECKIVATVQSHTKMPKSLKPYIDYALMDMYSLSDEMTESFAQNYLSKNNKDCGDICKVVSEKYGFVPPICLSLALNRLTRLSALDSETVKDMAEAKVITYGEAEKQYLLWLAKKLPKDKNSLIGAFMENLGESFGSDLVKNIFKLAIISNGQITHKELACILGADAETVNRILSNAKDFLYVYQGQVRVIHSDIESYFDVSDREVNLLLLDYLDTLPTDNPLKEKLYFTLSIITESYDKARDFLKNTSGKSNYTHLQRRIFQNDIRIKKGLFEFLKRSARFEKDELYKTVEIFRNFIFPTVSEADCDYYAKLLEDTFEICYKSLYDKDNVMYARATYTVAEICATVTRGKIFFNEFYNLCKETYEALDKNSPMYHIVSSDLALAREKLTSYKYFGEIGNSEAMKEYDEAINLTYACVEEKDLMLYTRSYIMSKKYSNLAVYLEDMLIFESEVSPRSEELERDLTSVISFCKNAIDNYDVDTHSQEKIKYIELLSDSYITLMNYFGTLNDDENICAYSRLLIDTANYLYELTGDKSSCDKLACAYFTLGINASVDLKERIECIEKNIELSNKLTEIASPYLANGIEHSANILKSLYFRYIHPNVDDTSDNLNDEFSNNRTWADETNYKEILKLCVGYFRADALSGVKCTVDNFMVMTLAQTLTEAVSQGGKIFDKAFEKIETDKAKAKEGFESIIETGEIIIELYDSMLMKTDERNMLEMHLLRLAIHINKLWKASHNLTILDKDNWEYWLDKCDCFASEMYFVAELNSVITQKEASRNYINVLKDENLHKKFTYCAKGEARLLAFCVKKKGLCLSAYQVATVVKKKKKHFYNMYQRLLLDGNGEVIDRINTVAEELCIWLTKSRLVDERVAKHIIYNSNFLECAALERAYRKGDFKLAEKIIGNGYDYYLEIGTLYIIQKYDRPRFLSVIGELKRICLKRTVNQIKSAWLNHEIAPCVLYGDDFCCELYRLCKKALENIDPNDTSDYRNRDEIKPFEIQ